MLVNLPHMPTVDRVAAILDEMSNRPVAELLHQGVYETGLNFDNHLEANGLLKNRYPFSALGLPHDAPVEERMRVLKQSIDEDWPDDFGVCDHWSQVIERWPELLTDPRRFVVTVTPIRKTDQTASGGWRWHKWGEYIGTKDPQYEYLYDEPDIDVVYVFHILEVR